MEVQKLLVEAAVLLTEDAEEDLLVDDQVEVEQARLGVLPQPVEVRPLGHRARSAPIIWLGTSKNSNILNQPSPVVVAERAACAGGVGPGDDAV